MDTLELAEKLAVKANTNLDVVSKGDVQSWYDHPCTKALVNTLQSDMAAIQHSWSIGAFTGAASSETIQKNSEAIGSLKSTRFMLEWIEDLMTVGDKEDD